MCFFITALLNPSTCMKNGQLAPQRHCWNVRCFSRDSPCGTFVFFCFLFVILVCPVAYLVGASSSFFVVCLVRFYSDSAPLPIGWSFLIPLLFPSWYFDMCTSDRVQHSEKKWKCRGQWNRGSLINAKVVLNTYCGVSLRCNFQSSSQGDRDTQVPLNLERKISSGQWQNHRNPQWVAKEKGATTGSTSGSRGQTRQAYSLTNPGGYDRLTKSDWTSRQLDPGYDNKGKSPMNESGKQHLHKGLQTYICFEHVQILCKLTTVNRTAMDATPWTMCMHENYALKRELGIFCVDPSNTPLIDGDSRKWSTMHKQASVWQTLESGSLLDKNQNETIAYQSNIQCIERQHSTFAAFYK